MNREARKQLYLCVALLFLTFLCSLMFHTIGFYASFREDVLFLQQKQEYLPITHWKIAFYIHVFSAVFVLLAGFTQFSMEFLKDHRPFHKLLGLFYVFNILLINAPVGMVMAIYANGGMAGKAAFITLDALWFWFTYRAYRYAKARNFVQHKAYMIRSYALSLSAITLRSWKLILAGLFALEPTQLYIIIAWLGFVPNWLIAEWIIRRGRSTRK